jgi:hypothetical protein
MADKLVPFNYKALVIMGRPVNILHITTPYEQKQWICASYNNGQISKLVEVPGQSGELFCLKCMSSLGGFILFPESGINSQYSLWMKQTD